jgi:predicted permease
MDLGTPALSLILALDGESATGNSTDIAVISLVSIVFGYLLLAALWYFVFRDKDRKKRGKGPSK